MELSLKNMQKNWLVAQFDHGNGYEHHQQNESVCHHSKISPVLVMYVHHSPTFKCGVKVDHSTDVFSFWGDDNDQQPIAKDYLFLEKSPAHGTTSLHPRR